MTKRITEFMIACVLVLAGCGGHSGSSAEPISSATDTPSDDFVGTWSGTYAQGDGSETGVGHRRGTVSVTIARLTSSAPGALSGVSVRGTAQDSERGAGTFGGFIVDQEPTNGIGQGSTMEASFPSSSASDLYKGRPRIDARGHLVGPVDLYLGDVSVPTQLDLAPMATP